MCLLISSILVLHCINGVVIAAQCTAIFFLDLLCSPNLDTRTWICRLNFVQRPIFSTLGSLTSLKSQTREPSSSLPEDLCSGFLRPEKTHRPQPGLNPRTLDLVASTLPRDHRGRQAVYLIIIIIIIIIIGMIILIITINNNYNICTILYHIDYFIYKDMYVVVSKE